MTNSFTACFLGFLSLLLVIGLATAKIHSTTSCPGGNISAVTDHVNSWPPLKNCSRDQVEFARVFSPLATCDQILHTRVQFEVSGQNVAKCESRKVVNVSDERSWYGVNFTDMGILLDTGAQRLIGQITARFTWTGGPAEGAFTLAYGAEYNALIPYSEDSRATKVFRMDRDGTCKVCLTRKLQAQFIHFKLASYFGHWGSGTVDVHACPTIQPFSVDYKPARQALKSSPAFVGCYHTEKLSNRPWLPNSGLPGFVAIDLWACMGRCSNVGEPYAAITGGLACFCESGTPEKKLPIDECVKPLFNNTISVFEIPGTVEPESVHIPKGAVTLYQAINVTATYPGAVNSSRVEMWVDWGDGRMALKVCSRVRCQLTHMYTTLGKHTIKVFSVDFKGGVKYFSEEVMVEEPLAGAALLCPAAAAVGAPTSCLVSIPRGAHVTGEVSVDGRDAPRLNITDPNLVIIGETEQGTYRPEESAEPPEYYTAVSSDLEFTQEGYLSAFKVTVQEAGPIVVLILRPDRPAEESDNSISPCQEAGPHGPVMAVNNLQTCRPARLLKTQRYTIVYEFTIGDLPEGPQYASLDNATQIRVLPGDIVGVVKNASTGGLAVIKWGSETWVYFLDEPASGWGIGEVINIAEDKKESSPKPDLAIFMVQTLKVAIFNHTFHSASVPEVSVRLQSDSGNFSDSKKVRLQIPVTGLSVNVSRFTPFGQETVYKIILENGSHPKLTWNDSSGVGDVEVDIVGLNYEVRRRYERSGEYSLAATVTNLVSFSTSNCSTTVLYKIDGVSVSINPTVLGQPSPIAIEISSGSLVSAVMSLGDGSGDVNITGVDLATPSLSRFVMVENHTYSDVGAYYVSLAASNPVGQESSVGIAYVQRKVEGLNVSAVPDVISNERNFTMNVSIQAGTNATFIVKLSPGVEKYPEWRGANGTLARFVIPKDELQVGSLSIECAVSNLVGELKRVFQTRVYVPITEPSVSVKEAHATGEEVSVVVGVEQGSDVEAKLLDSTGRGTRLGISPVNKGRIPLRYYTPGVYTIHVNFTNPVSRGQAVATVAVYDAITSVDLRATTTIPYPPGDTRVFLEASTPWPSNASFFLDFGDGFATDLQPFTGPVNMTHRFNVTGMYSVSAFVGNPLGNVTETVIIQVIQRITFLEVNLKRSAADALAGQPGSGPAQNVFPVDYHVGFELVKTDGSILYLRWDYGDNVNENAREDKRLIWHRYQSPGQYVANLTAADRFGSFSTAIPVIIKQGFVGVRVDEGSPIVVDTAVEYVVAFVRLGDPPAVVNVTLGDGRSLAFVTPDLESDARSKWTGVEVHTLGPLKNLTFTHKYDKVGEFHASVSFRNDVSEGITSHRTVVLKQPCRYPEIHFLNAASDPQEAPELKTSEETTIYTENKLRCSDMENTEFTWTVFRVSGSHSNGTCMVNVSADVRQSNLVIPAFTLPDGLYRLHFGLRTVGSLSFVVFADGFIRFVAGDLKAGIRGGDARSVPFHTSVLVDGSVSRDWDLPSGDLTGMEFKWLCRPANGDLPRGGCYGDGPGILPDTTASIRLDTGKMAANGTYVVTLMITKGTRSSNFSQTLQILPGDSLSVTISCIMNCKELVDPRNKLAVEGSCANCSAEDDVSYRWILYEKNAMSWLEVSDLRQRTSTSAESRFLGLKKRMLDGGKSYKLVLHAWKGRRRGGPTSFSEYRFMTNRPPTGGRCGIDPAEGEAGTTEFTITCRGWVDSDTPLFYKAEQASGDPMNSIVLHNGPRANFPAMVLPAGHKSNGFAYDITVLISDSRGSASAVHLGVKVTPAVMTVEEMKQFTGEGSDLRDSMLSGDTQRFTQLINSVGSCLDNSAHEEKEEVEHGGPGDESGHHSHLGYSEATKSRMQLRDELMAACLKVKPNSLAAVVQLTGALVSLSNQVDEIGEKSQLGLSSTLSNMMSLLVSRKDTAPPDLLEQASEGVTKCVANLFGSSAHLFGLLKRYTSSTQKEVNKLKSETKTGKNSEEKLNELSGAETELGHLKEETEHFKQTTRVATMNGMSALRSLVNILLSLQSPGEDAWSLSTAEMTFRVQTHLPSNVGGKAIVGVHSRFDLPSSDDLFRRANISDSPIGVQVVEMESNPFPWADSASAVNSLVTELAIEQDGSDVKIEGLSNTINITLPTPGGSGLTHSMVRTRCGKQNSHRIQITQKDVALKTKITPINSSAPVRVFYRRSKPASPVDHDLEWSNLRKENSSEERGLDIFISNVHLNRNASGVHYLSVVVDCDPNDDSAELNYTLLSYTASCVYWDTNKEEFVGKGCEVGPLTTPVATRCMCNHLTSFGGGVFVAPNPIDFDKVASGFSNLSENHVVFTTVLVIVGVYFILLAWARWADKRDMGLVGVVPLPSNDPRDSHAYEVTVHTGYEKGAGTTANVYLQLIGSLGDSDTRMLKDPNHRRFKQGAMDQFLLTVPQSLGTIKTIHLWHDNDGKSPGWFLFRVQIRDLQSDQRWWFMCDRWLALDEDDGMIERRLNVATKRELTRFKVLFINTTRKNLLDGHLWLSVFTRPPKSSFTRVQRLSCCLSLMLSTLLANMMFFSFGGEPADTVKIGPVRLSPRQLIISIQSTIIVMPINVLIVSIFRKLKPKEDRSKKYEKADEPDEKSEDDGVVENTEETQDKDEKKKPRGFKGWIYSFRGGDKQKPKKKFLFPHWCLYVAYLLVFVVSSVCGTFCVFYGMTFGEDKSLQWLSAVMISFWQSVIIMQPFKVFLLAFFFALIIKDPNKEVDSDGQTDPALAFDEEFIPTDELGYQSPDSSSKPPDVRRLETARQLRLKHKKMNAVLWEIVAHFFVVLLVMFVAFGNHDEQAFRLNREAIGLFVEGKAAGFPISYVKSSVDYWTWVSRTLVPSLYPWRTLYGYPQVSIVENGDARYVVGVGRVRQLRIKKDTCQMPRIFSPIIQECNGYYSWPNEESGDFQAAWTRPQASNDTPPAALGDRSWEYQKMSETKSVAYMGKMATYRGGGYIIELGPDNVTADQLVDALDAQHWIDRYTRALLAELSVYNVDVNLLCVVTLAYELLPTGGGASFVNVQTIRLFRSVGAASVVVLLFEVVFMFALFRWIYRDIKNLVKNGRAHLKKVWNVVDVAITLLSTCAVGVYFSRLLGIHLAIKQFEKNRSQFVSFQYVVLLNEVVIALIAAVVLLLNMKFLKLLRFNRKVSVLSSSMKAASKPLMSFFVMFSVIICAYSSVLFLAMGSTLKESRTFFRAVVSTCAMVLGQFDYYAMESANRIMGPVVFFSFMVLVQFIVLNMFVGILCEGFSEVRSDSSKQSGDYEITDFMMNRLKSLLGIFVEPPVRPTYAEPRTPLEENVDTIEDRADVVMTRMRGICAEDLRQVKWLKLDRTSSKMRKVLSVALSLDETEDDFFASLSALSKLSEEQLDRMITQRRSGGDEASERSSVGSYECDEFSSPDICAYFDSVEETVHRIVHVTPAPDAECDDSDEGPDCDGDSVYTESGSRPETRSPLGQARHQGSSELRQVSAMSAILEETGEASDATDSAAEDSDEVDELIGEEMSAVLDTKDEVE